MMNILKVCPDEFLVTDGEEVFRIMSRDDKLEVEYANFGDIHREVCKDCAIVPETHHFRICDKCPKEVERR